jgi:hypothetical protein
MNFQGPYCLSTDTPTDVRKTFNPVSLSSSLANIHTLIKKSTEAVLFTSKKVGVEVNAGDSNKCECICVYELLGAL